MKPAIKLIAKTARIALLVFAALVGSPRMTLSVEAKPVVFELPTETAAFKPGKGVELVRANCAACHSADYIKIQPRGPGFKKDFWQGEVTKMIKVFGAPIAPQDADKIVAYLSNYY